MEERSVWDIPTRAMCLSRENRDSPRFRQALPVNSPSVADTESKSGAVFSHPVAGRREIWTRSGITGRSPPG